MNNLRLFENTPTPVVAIVWLFLVACHPQRDEPVIPGEINLETTDASELYFQNVRKSDYQPEEWKEAGLTRYWHKSAKPDAQLPILMISWRHDRAYLGFEGNDSLTAIIDTDTISLQRDQQRLQVDFALQIYNAILRGDSVLLLQEGRSRPFFAADQTKQTFRIIVFDFLRLVEAR